MRNIRNALATAKMLDHSNNAALEGIGEAISVLFSTLANMEPQLALSVLEQLEDQLDQKIVDELLSERSDMLEELAEAVTLDPSDFEEWN